MEEVKVKHIKSDHDYLFAVGRRRNAIARVRLFKNVRDNMTFGKMTVKKGDVLVNGKNIFEYFSGAVSKTRLLEPFDITKSHNKYTITIKVVGGGMSGQLTATLMGLARVFEKVDPEHRKALKKRGFLERDSRIRERRKVGMGGKARRKRQSPKR